MASAATSWINGSLHLPLNHLHERIGELPPNRPLLVYCAGGYRSSLAASLLQRAGLHQVSEIAGGLSAWTAVGLPVSEGDTSRIRNLKSPIPTVRSRSPEAAQTILPPRGGRAQFGIGGCLAIAL